MQKGDEYLPVYNPVNASELLLRLLILYTTDEVLNCVNKVGDGVYFNRWCNKKEINKGLTTVT